MIGKAQLPHGLEIVICNINTAAAVQSVSLCKTYGPSTLVPPFPSCLWRTGRP